MNIIGIIPARSGSKGVPNKNLRLVGNISLLGKTILSAQKSKKLNEFFVSTDSREYIKEAEKYNAKPPFLRPKELASDTAPTWQTLLHTVRWYENKSEKKVDAVVTLQPTTPFRSGEDIDKAIEIFSNHQPQSNCLISVCKEKEKHPLTLYYSNGNQSLTTFIKNKNQNIRRQKFPDIFWRNGAIYITRIDLLQNEKKVISDTPLFYEMPRDRSSNIDTLLDLDIANLINERYESSNN